MLQRAKLWWKEDPFRKWLLIGGFAYALFFSQGIPLWDDDFTSWFWKIKDHSIFTYIWQWIWPISTQPQYWGFNERPLQKIIYKFCYMISGYESWSYFLLKSAAYAGIGVMIYQWVMRIVPTKTTLTRWAAVAAAVFFILTPGPMAAHVMHQDIAPYAEFLFLVITYFIWDAVEKTPEEWRGLPNFKDPVHKKWLLKWAGLAFASYLGYKAKADLKMIPVILGAYILVVRRKQLGFFAFPIGLMLLLAVPWGPGIFSKLPPFIPGSQGSQIGWMWQPAKLSNMLEYFVSSSPYNFRASLHESTVALGGLLGPFLLLGMIAFLIWRSEGALDKVPWRRLSESSDRARAFALIWWVVIMVATSALPVINYIFRIRYGIVPMVPTALLLGWVFGLFALSLDRLPKWAVRLAIALLVIQSGINLNRSIGYRRDMGQVMVAVDQVYENFAKNFPTSKLTLLPDFRPYDYRPDAPKAFQDKEWLKSADELTKNHTPGDTYVISWKPSLWEQLEMVSENPGCRKYVLFDRIFRCPAGTGAYLMRYIGENDLYKEGEELRSKGDIAGARRVHEEFLAQHPKSLAGQFVVGLESYQLKDYARAQEAYAVLEQYFPDHLSILYNHALALEELKEYGPAIDRLKYIVDRDPANYAAMIHLYWSYQKDGQKSHAKDTLVAMKRAFPNDPDVNRLLSSVQ